MKRYAIWNKKDRVITPAGKVYTAEQWMAMYPVAELNTVTVVCSAGEVNGGFFGTLGQMVEHAKNNGCDFTNCVTDVDKLNAIEAFEDSIAAKAAEKAAEAAAAKDMDSASLASIAASLEFQNMMALEDIPEEEVI